MRINSQHVDFVIIPANLVLDLLVKTALIAMRAISELYIPLLLVLVTWVNMIT
jgi:hypothetical protein